jgi:23S rRNA pseudouridine1911/1915/1917 synthase
LPRTETRRIIGAMAKPPFIRLPGVAPIPILYEDRAALALDKPAGWLIAPTHWLQTRRNLQAAIESSIAHGDFWARSRGLKFLRFVHRLDAETSGVMLWAKSPGAVDAFGELFERREVEKIYWAVVAGRPKEREWICALPIGPHPRERGRYRVDARAGKPAETRFRLLQTRGGLSLLEARPVTGRTHQIRTHLAASGCPVLGDPLYGRPGRDEYLGLRSVALRYADPFTRRFVNIRAPVAEFCRRFGFDVPEAEAARIGIGLGQPQGQNAPE